MGEKKALEIYLALCQRVKDVLTQCSETVYVYYSENIPEENDLWSSPKNIKKVQANATDLGVRMKLAFNEILPLHPSVLLLGTDIPHLSANIIQDAFKFLKNHETVFGPAEDGGYYLVGLNKMYPFLFENMTWSVDYVFKGKS